MNEQYEATEQKSKNAMLMDQNTIDQVQHQMEEEELEKQEQNQEQQE